MTEGGCWGDFSIMCYGFYFMNRISPSVLQEELMYPTMPEICQTDKLAKLNLMKLAFRSRSKIDRAIPQLGIVLMATRLPKKQSIDN